MQHALRRGRRSDGRRERPEHLDAFADASQLRAATIGDDVNIGTGIRASDQCFLARSLLHRIPIEAPQLNVRFATFAAL